MYYYFNIYIFIGYIILQDVKTTDNVSGHNVQPVSTVKHSIAMGLTHLYLSGNNFTEIPCDFLLYFPDVQWLDLRKNKIKHVFNDVGSISKSILSSQANSQEKNFLIEVGIY